MNLLYTTTSYGVFSKFNVVIKIYGKIPLLCIKFIHEAKIFSTWFYTPLLYISEIKLQRRKKKRNCIYYHTWSLTFKSHKCFIQGKLEHKEIKYNHTLICCKYAFPRGKSSSSEQMISWQKESSGGCSRSSRNFSIPAFRLLKFFSRSSWKSWKL